MTLSFKFLSVLMLLAFQGLGSLATPILDRAIVPTVDGVSNLSARTTTTCADPSLARTVYQGFSGTLLCHILHFHWAFINADTQQSNGPPTWSFQGPVFKAWPAQQPFTMPLFRLTTPTNTDFVFVVGADAQTPPVVSGFSGTSIDIVAWVYNTPICDSVPLMVAVFAAKSDHYYTTDPDEHAALLAVNGWTDGGIVAYVLPLPTF